MAQYNISNNSFGTSTKSNYEVVMIANSSGNVINPPLSDNSGRQLVRPLEDSNFLNAVTGTLSSPSQTVIVPMAGFNGCSIAVTGTFSAAFFSMMASYDGGITYVNVNVRPTDSTASGITIAPGISGPKTYNAFVPTATHFRVTLTSISSGTVNIRLCPYFNGAEQSISVGSPLPVVITPVTSNPVSQNPLVYRLLSSAATTNPINIKSSIGRIYLIVGYNSSASVRYLKIYNKSSSPTVGTDTPIITLAIPASSSFRFDLNDTGYYLSSGISFAITAAIADADTTAISANDIVGMNVFYY